MTVAPESPATRLALLATRQILDQAIAGRFEAGDRLTELALTARLGVSRTPVRAALRFLHQRGLLDHAPPHRGYTLQASQAELARVQRALPQDEASAFYYQLLRDRTAGRLGAQVTERELEQAYGQRATLVREVLVRMLQHGIVRGRRGQRWEFSEALDADSERESYRFRMVLECAALAEPGFRMDPERLAACRQRQQSLINHATRRSWLDFFEANAELHELLAGASGNRFMLKALQEQNRLRRISDLSDYPLVNVERLRESCQEHLAMLDAIERGRLKEAAQLMRTHLQGASDLLEKRVAGKLG